MDALRMKEAASKAGLSLSDEQVERRFRSEPRLKPAAPVLLALALLTLGIGAVAAIAAKGGEIAKAVTGVQGKVFRMGART